MIKKMIPLFKRHATVLLLFGGLSTYILVAGTTGSCPTCVAITDTVGITSLASVGGDSSNDRVKAPAWTLKDVDGQTVSSADFQGKVVLIDFWATWCPPCRKMIPGLIELQKEYGGQGFQVVGISLDEGGASVVQAFNKNLGVNYTSLLADGAVVEAFGGIRSIPTSFLIDQDGRIVARHVGYVPAKRLESEITRLLAPEST